MKKIFLTIALIALMSTLAGCTKQIEGEIVNINTEKETGTKISTETGVSSTAVKTTPKTTTVSPQAGTQTSTQQNTKIPIFGLNTYTECGMTKIAIYQKVRAICEEKAIPVPHESGDLIEKNPAFVDIKATTNGEYSVYSLNGLIGKYYGKFSETLDSQPGSHIIFDNATARKGFFINGNYNHMPRKVDVYVDIDDPQTGDYSLKQNKDFDKTEVIAPVKSLIGKDRDILVAQYFQCDINGDGKVEKIVNYNNYYTATAAEKEKLQNSSAVQKAGIANKFYNVMVILDQNNQIISYLTKIPSIDNIRQSGLMIKYFVDIDHDNIMEIVTEGSIPEFPEAETDCYKYFKLKDGNLTSKAYIDE